VNDAAKVIGVEVATRDGASDVPLVTGHAAVRRNVDIVVPPLGPTAPLVLPLPLNSFDGLGLRRV
jgi:hypothetical protein